MFFNKKKVEEPVIKIAEEPAEELLQPQSEIVMPQPEPPKREEDKPEPSDTTFIGKGIVFYGDFTGDDPIIVNGVINGNISTSNSLTVSGSGSYKGSAKIADLHVDGRAEGEIDCDNLSVLGERSVVKGQLATSYLESHKGSSFKGSLKLTGMTDADDSEEAAEPVSANVEKEVTEEDLFGSVFEPEGTAPAEDPAVEKLSEDPLFALNTSSLGENIKAPELFGESKK